MGTEQPASEPPATTLWDRIDFCARMPLFLARFLIAFAFRVDRTLHWRQKLAVSFLQSARRTFPPARPRRSDQPNPTGVAIRAYCQKHHIGHTETTLRLDDISGDLGLDLPQPRLHLVARRSAPTTGPTLVYFHGGGYVTPIIPAGHMPFALKCAQASRAKDLLLLEYSLSPEHPYPAQLIQAVACLRYLLDDLRLRTEDIVIVGDSAGAHLASSLLLHIVKPSPYAAPIDLGGSQIKAVVFVSPWVMMDTDNPSYDANEKKDFISRARINEILPSWKPKAEDVWACPGEADGAAEAWAQVFPRAGAGPVKRAFWGVGSAEVILDSVKTFTDDFTGAETIFVNKGVDCSAFVGKDFIVVEGEGDAHAQPVLDSAVGYDKGNMMRAIMRWLESSRLYLLASTAKYEMFTLLNNEIAFDVELSSLDCGLNGALYFVMMEEDGGMGRYPTNTAGAEFGTGYCDSKCSQGLRFVGGKANNEGWIPSETDDTGGKGYYGACCSEVNVWDANSQSFAVSAHPCVDNVYHICDVDSCGGAFSEGPLSPDCDPIGCDFNPYRMGVKDFYGPGKTVDTTKRFTVVTQFTEYEVTRYFVQDGKRIDMPESAIDGVSGNSLNDEFCQKKAYVFDERDRFNELGGWPKFQEAMGGKWVLVMSIRDDHYSHMLWLDSTYPPERAGEIGTERGDCEGDSGDPNQIESTLGHATVTFSNIRFGPVGSTVDI
ncbi:uncharacterized protein DNG_02106 [Cephalotrichum gorgonifer]|uniref:Glucanase n=1 Tax=Cephalotrichum gorgonifer TaxID=2041049 RepID=A0AAE8MT14_9PEZI|nr:uncharacterized protein DNG_02106 [Cephalotrichum gorgonifer]